MLCTLVMGAFDSGLGALIEVSIGKKHIELKGQSNVHCLCYCSFSKNNFTYRKTGNTYNGFIPTPKSIILFALMISPTGLCNCTIDILLS